MRILPTDEQQIRREKILQAVIHLYIKTGRPVGSTSILENFRMNLSPATIRNVLADLEKEGYLTHPHTSAGRTPTDLGYRYYVDSLVKIQRLAEEEEKRIHTEYARRIQEVQDLMRSTTRILSTLSHCTGFAIQASPTEDRLRRIDLIPVNPNQVVGILVSESGLVRNQMIGVSHMPDEPSLRFASQFLTEQLRGLSFSQAQGKLVEELEKYELKKIAQKDFFENLRRQLFDGSDQSSVYVEGTSNIFDFPEFQDLKSLRDFARLVDKKETLAQVLKDELNRKGLQVRIGTETSPELRDFSVVSSTYTVRGRPLGVLGILGPKRMQYDRMISIVNTVTELVNRFLDQTDDDFLEE